VTGVLLIGGKAPELKSITSILSRADYIVAADSGFDLTGIYGIEPDIVVGDMDSVEQSDTFRSFPDHRKRIYSEDKDDTDTELGLEILKERGCDERILIGGGEGRLDHTLGILALFERDPHPHLWLTGRESIMSIEEEIIIDTYPDQRISLFPLGNEVCTMRSEGLKWELDELEWSRGEFGLSNRALSDRVRITVTKGRLLMVRELPRER
jgi:thiamine pyrophosphokinase